MLVKCILISVTLVFALLTMFCNTIFDYGTKTLRRRGRERSARHHMAARHWAVPMFQIIFALAAVGVMLIAILIHL